MIEELMTKTYLLPKAEITVLGERLLRVEYKPDVQVEVSDIVEAQRIYEMLFPGQRIFLLTVINHGATATLEARNYWSTPERSQVKVAEAIIIDNLAHKLIASFIKKVNPPKHTLSFFTTENKGLEWLKQFKADFESRQLKKKVSFSEN